LFSLTWSLSSKRGKGALPRFRLHPSKTEAANGPVGKSKAATAPAFLFTNAEAADFSAQFPYLPVGPKCFI
jgi:hypothetical protein